MNEQCKIKTTADVVGFWSVLSRDSLRFVRLGAALAMFCLWRYLGISGSSCWRVARLVC